jgi:hypothetical protein
MEKKYLGTYPIRKIGKSEQGIHMPSSLCGTFSIYLADDGVVSLVPQGIQESSRGQRSEV